MNRFAAILSAACLTAYLLSVQQIAEAAPGVYRLANKPKAVADYLAEKRVLTPAEFGNLEFGYRRFAFTIADVESKRLIAEARDTMAEAVRSGGGFGAWRGAVEDAFKKAGVEPMSPWHAETVYRTNVASAYSAAQWDTLNRPTMIEEFPIWQFETVGDNRVSAVCRPLHGVTLPAGHAFWRTHWTPLHHACRSRIRPIHRDDAEGVKITERIPPVEPGAGFGHAGGAEAHWAVADEIAVGEKPTHKPKAESRPKPRTFATDEDATAWGDSAFRSWQESLSRDELEALNDYKGYGDVIDYEAINGHLRGTNRATGDRLQRVKRDIRLMDQALARGAAPEDVTVYRVTGSNWLPTTDPEKLVGVVFHDTGYRSTTLRHERTTHRGDVSFEVHLPKGTRCGWLEGEIGGGPTSEFELLLPRGTSLRVVSAREEERRLWLICEVMT